jgi:hypothetical protein
MERDAVQDKGLAPQESGEGEENPRVRPEEQGKDAVPAQEMRKLYRELRKWKDKYRDLNSRRVELEEREKALEQVKARLADAHLTRILIDAAEAQDAINPQQVASILKDRVKLGDDLNPVVAGHEAEGREEANPATVEQLIIEFLSQYPYHRRAKLSGGSGSSPSPTAAADSLRERINSASSHEELEKIVSRKRP